MIRTSSLAGLLVLSSLAVGYSQEELPEGAAGQASAGVENPVRRTSYKLSKAEMLEQQTLAQTADNTITGRFARTDGTSGRVPAADVQVTFVQNGAIIGDAQTGRDGRFSIKGLEPGVYSVFAVGPSGLGVFTMTVNSRDGSVPPTLEPTTLVPPEDTAVLARLLRNAFPEQFAANPNGFPPAGAGGGGDAGSGGGGGGGDGSLAGLAGLAGLLSLLGDDEPTQASPFQQ